MFIFKFLEDFHLAIIGQNLLSNIIFLSFYTKLDKRSEKATQTFLNACKFFAVLSMLTYAVMLGIFYTNLNDSSLQSSQSVSPSNNNGKIKTPFLFHLFSIIMKEVGRSNGGTTLPGTDENFYITMLFPLFVFVLFLFILLLPFLTSILILSLKTSNSKKNKKIIIAYSWMNMILMFLMVPFRIINIS